MKISFSIIILSLFHFPSPFAMNAHRMSCGPPNCLLQRSCYQDKHNFVLCGHILLPEWKTRQAPLTKKKRNLLFMNKIRASRSPYVHGDSHLASDLSGHISLPLFCSCFLPHATHNMGGIYMPRMNYSGVNP